MTNALVKAAVIPSSLFLAACGPDLGQYEIRDVRLVPAEKLAEIDNSPSYDGPEKYLLRIEFTSPTNLEEVSEGGDLYVHGDFCPFKDEYRLSLLGPFYNDQSRLLSTRVTSYEKLPDGRERMSVESTNRNPVREPATGRFVYTAYLIPSAPKDQFSEAYDLRRDTRGDLCLRIDHPGYYVTRSKSDVFKLQASSVRNLLAGTEKSLDQAAN